MKIRFSKFPFVFFSFGKAVECEVDTTNKTIKTKSNIYKYKEFNKFLFLFIKYFPVCLIFYFLFSAGDFIFTLNKFLSYLLSAILLCLVLFFTEVLRFISISFFFVISLCISIYTKDYLLIAFILKYFVFFSVLLCFSLDLRYKAFSLISGDKIVSHFLSRKLK